MPEDSNTKIVEEGSKVTVKIGERIKEFTIVATNKVNVVIGAISFESPLGKSIIGAKVGDIVSYRNPIGQIIFVEIISIG